MGAPLLPRLALAALVLLLPEPAAPVELPLPQVIGKAEGLLSSQVHDVAIGPQGFVWLAGPSGLARYNGRGVEVFGTAQGLSTLGLRSVATDPGGGLWVGHDLGLDHWRPDTGFAPAVPADKWDFGFVEAILPIAPGEVWLAARDGLVRLERGAGIVESSMPGKLVTSMIQTSEGVVWAAGPALGLWRLDEGGWGPPARDEWRSAAPISVLAASMEGRLFVGGERLLEIDPTGRVLDALEPPWAPRPVTAIRRTGDDLWASMGGRVALFGATDSGWEFSQTALASDGALAIEADRQENVWVGTDRTGAVKFSGLRSVVRRLPQPCDTAVLSVSATGAGELTLGGTACTWRAREGSYEVLEEIVGLRGVQAWDVLRARDGRVWVASNRGLLTIAREATDVATTGLLAPARSLLESAGTLYVGTLKGLFARRDEAFEEQLTADGESLGYVYTLERDPSGRIWIGTLGKGLWTLDPPGVVERSRLSGLGESSNVYDVELDAAGAVVVSENDAVVLFEPGASAPSLRFATGTPSWTVRFDDAGRLLRGSSTGLAIHDRASGASVHQIGAGAGLAGGELTTSRSLYQAVDGILIAGTDGGASLVDLGRLQGTQELPAPVALRVEGEPFDVVDGRRRLTRGRWSLDVYPAVPWFLDERSIRFRYRMRGFVEEWTDLPEGSASIRFTSLPRGRYDLEAQAVSSLAGPGPAATLLSFDVVRPWWWLPAVALTVLATAALGGLLPWLRARALTRRGKALEGLVEERTQELASALGEMKRVAMEDRLTGLPNRRRLHQELARLAARAERTGNDFVMIVMDLDSLKEINDRYGHEAGDAVLRQTAERLVAAARKSDVVSRYGGDEFVTLGWDDQGAADLLAERQRAALASGPMDLPSGAKVVSTGSFGVCSWVSAGRDPEQLYRLADRALYVAKRAGDRVQVWSEELDAEPVP